ncbi:MAG: rhodanese-like domain-containing protein [Thermodesulfobacteriota bacterium]|nr:rhodanese-like domain-containing protein [Thermodesulfobacteriota bacterium]
MKKITGPAAFLFLMIAGIATAGIEYNYIDSDSLMISLQEKESVHLVDIQKKNDFLQHHFFGSVVTDAYPVKSEQDMSRIKEIIPDLQATDKPVVIIGPRGTRAAGRAYEYLLEQGIAAQRLAILQKGIRGWPAPEILLNTSGQ